MNLSHRITHLTNDATGGWGLYMRAREMVEAGIDVTVLTIGEHDVRTDPSILEAMHDAAKSGHTGYAAIAGVTGLRERIAARVTARTGVKTTADNVLVTPGGQAALFAAHHAVCDDGDTALYIDPYYATYPGTLRGVGAVAKAIPTRSRDAFRPTRAALEAAAPGARSLLINTPNNPTGVIYDRATVQTIADVVKAHDLWLISDEVYDTQIWEGQHISPRSLPDMANRTLVIGSMSKSHAMTGSRCGWVVGPKEAIAHMTNLATHTTYGVPGYIQDAAIFAMDQGDALEAQIAEPFRRRRDLAMQVLGEQNTVVPIPAQGAMYLMLDIRATGLSGEAFANRLLDTHHIAVMPGESFGTAASGHLRVAMTVEDTTLVAALRRLCAFAAEIAET